MRTVAKGHGQAGDTGSPALGRVVPVPPTVLSQAGVCTGAHTLIMYSMRLWECFSITDSIHIKGLTCRGRRDDTHTWSWYEAPFQRETKAQGEGPFTRV